MKHHSHGAESKLNLSSRTLHIVFAFVSKQMMDINLLRICLD